MCVQINMKSYYIKSRDKKNFDMHKHTCFFFFYVTIISKMFKKKWEKVKVIYIMEKKKVAM